MEKKSFPGGSAGKEPTCSVEVLGSIPGLGRSHGEGKGYPLQYSGLDNSRDYAVHGVSKSWTRLSDFHSLPHSGIGVLRVAGLGMPGCGTDIMGTTC